MRAGRGDGTYSHYLLKLCAFVIAICGGSVSAQSLDQAFAPSALTSAETRALQGALAATDDYVGLIDGEWGQFSHRALDAWNERQGRDGLTFADLGSLMAGYENFLRHGNWQTYRLSGSPYSFAFPWAILTQPDDGSNTIGWRSESGGFSLLVSVDGRSETQLIHRTVLEQAAPFSEPYHSAGETRLVTSIRMNRGQRAYARSDWAGQYYVTLIVFADRANSATLNFFVSSIDVGGGASIEVPSYGILRRAIQSTRRIAPAPPQVSLAPAPANPADPPTGIGDAAIVAPEPGRAIRTGTGFFVNPTDLVTAQHVTDGCDILALQDGTTLARVAENGGLDLAVWSSSMRSRHWIALDSDDGVRLGQSAYALGYPYLDILGNDLSVTGGNISSLGNQSDPERFLRFTAPVQPGNSGGPLLSNRGRVVGVVVARTNDRFFLEETGSLPQNINFAAPVSALVRFLEDSLVVVPGRGLGEFELDEGLPEEIGAAVVPIYCFD